MGSVTEMEKEEQWSEVMREKSLIMISGQEEGVLLSRTLRLPSKVLCETISKMEFHLLQKNIYIYTIL